ncbi:DUF3515 domain-containing protein [Actinomycetospora cinnamomea]|uniref:Uncharacterized protein DUF3515 n=1 Tax=Actinomycetospora cinnamomea TaxID=663609 RepID=A0A2U1FQT1_9PSEU|nr:DUF3515 domain-containing protein [Actinomycetospora cinnamomea]PVZ14553.1 uncharacterized protein DUF3515 [Actinomycetospora cinnamomea]
MAPTRAPEVVRRLPRVLVGIVLTLPVLVVVGVLVASVVLVRDPVPDVDTVRLPVPAVPVPAAASADCSRLLSGLPGEIPTERGLMPRRVLAVPAPAATVAWGGEDATPPIVLRCGLPQPAELHAGASVLDVEGVEWIAVDDPAPGTSTWVTADRAVYIGLTIPAEMGTGPIEDVSRGVKIALVSRPAG